MKKPPESGFGILVAPGGIDQGLGCQSYLNQHYPNHLILFNSFVIDSLDRLLPQETH